MSDPDILERLYSTIASRRRADPTTSYTAKLFAGGSRHAAQKLGEEAVEAAIAAALGDKENLVGEAADVLYHLLVVLASTGVTLDEVLGELARREGRSGFEHKAANGR